MVEKDYEGVVTSVCVPSPDGNGHPCFVFSMLQPIFPPRQKPPSPAPVFYRRLDEPFTREVMEIVMIAYRDGLVVQVGLKDKKSMSEWVQLPQGPSKRGSKS